MSLHADVWKDLLSLYLADEASVETRQLVEKRLRGPRSCRAGEIERGE